MPLTVSTIVLTVRRNLVSILVPVGVSWAIYADWSRTRAYKAKKAEIASKQSETVSLS